MVFAPLTTLPTPATLAPRATSLNHGGTPPVAALTTVWTPSQGCFPVSTRSTTDIDMFWTSHTDCAPPGYASYFETYYYSPAICPSGFTVGCSRYGDFQGPPVEPTETAMLCVMSDYFCTPGEWNYYATNTELSFAQVMIQIRWAESDLTILETHPLTPGFKLATGTTGGDADLTRTTSSGVTVTVISSSPSHSGDGLSIGARVGIGVGVGLFGFIAVGLAVFFILRHRRKRATGQDNNQIPSVQQPPQGQYPFHQYPQVTAQFQQGQQAQGYSIYAPYVDPKTGVVSYYSPIPQPTELGGTAVGSLANVTSSQGAPSVTGSQSTYLQDSTLPGNQPTPFQESLGAGIDGTSPVGRSPASGPPSVAEMPGSEGIAMSVGGSDNSQVQQEMAHLMAEQAKLDARRTRLMELAELDEEEQRIRIRMNQLQSESQL